MAEPVAMSQPGAPLAGGTRLLVYPNAKYVDAMFAHELYHSQDNTFPAVWTDADGHALNPDGTTDPYHTANSNNPRASTAWWRLLAGIAHRRARGHGRRRVDGASDRAAPHPVRLVGFCQ